LLAACGGGGPANDTAAAPTPAATPMPAPSASPVATLPHVVDQAELLGAAKAAELEAKLAAFEQRTKHRLVVVTAPSLEGHPIDDVTEALGAQMDVRDGVILLVALKEREVRLAVGKGASKLLNDREAKRIVNQTMYPDLHANRYGPAIERGAAHILAELSETIA
jgi:uncharacterized protein